MLDIVPSTEKRPCTMMPVELAPYLLSASPPSSGFSLHSLTLTSSYTSSYFFSSAPSNLTCPPPARVRMFGTCAHSTTMKSSMSLKADETSDSHSESDRSTEAPTGPKSSSKKMKRVSFADHMGKPLTEVRLVVDRPIYIDLEECLSKNAQDDDSPPEPLEFKGSQPFASDSFLEDLKRKMVAVENVFADNYKVTCILCVKKRPSAKKVFARHTLDSWQSHQDVNGFLSFGERTEHQTYKIEFEVPRTADRSRPVEFAVCYEVDGVQHWDNNEGKNYILEWNVQGPEKPNNDDSNGNPVNLAMAWWSKDTSSHAYY